MIDYQLKEYQKEGISYCMDHHYCIIGDAMGLGKTLQAIEVIKRTGHRALIVCPAFLKYNWKREIEKFSDLTAVVFKQNTKYDDEYDVAILSYSALNRAEELFRRVDVIVFDEIHYLKNPDAKRTQYAHHLVRTYKPERLIGLSGTAIKNRVPEFYSLFLLMSYNPRGTSGVSIHGKYDYWNFCRTFSHMKQFKIKGRTVTKFEGHRNVELLREIKEDKYIRRKASDVLDLPPITRKDIILDDEYIDQELLDAWNDGKTFPSKKVNSARIKTKHTAKYVKDLLDQGEGPVIIFTDHVKSAQDLGLHFNSVRVVTGEVGVDTRDKIVQDFQAGKFEVLVATFGSLSTGYTITKASNMVMNDLPWIPGVIAQTEKRIHRIGQDKHCTIHRIFWGRIDAMVAKELDKKIETILEVL